MKPLFQNEFGSDAAAIAAQAGAKVCDTWELRAAPRGAVLVSQSTLGWWGVYRNGERGRIARRRDLASAVRVASAVV